MQLWMANLLKLNYFVKFARTTNIRIPVCQSSSISLTQQEVATALRPFYFAVHPDLFYQFPKEKEINENSLKQLNFYLETVLKNLPTNPTSVTFCLKSGPQKVDSTSISFKQVNIQLLGKDLHRVLYNILSSCQLPTEYLDALQKSKPEKKTAVKHKDSFGRQSQKFHASWWNEAGRMAEDIEERIRNEPDIDLRLLSCIFPKVFSRSEILKDGKSISY